MGQHTGADMRLLSDMLPRVEPLIINNLIGEEPQAVPEEATE